MKSFTRSFASRALAAVALLLALSARAGDLTFLDVPRVSVQDPAVFRAIFERSRTELVRVAIFGDSQETAPNGWGVHYLAHINAGLAKIYGPTGESNLLSNTTQTSVPYWLATTHASAAIVASTVPTSAVVPGIFNAALLSGAKALDDSQRSVFLHDASRCIDSTLNGGPWFDQKGPFVADVLAIATPNSPGIRWSNAPTDGNDPDATAAVVQSGLFTFNRATAAGTHVWFTTPVLEFASRRHLQIALSGNSSRGGAEVVGIRFRSVSAARGITVQSFSAGGLRLPHLIEQFGASGSQLRVLAPSVAVLHYGANDAGNGITSQLWRTQLLAAIAWIRAAMQDPQFPIIIAAELQIGGADATAMIDRMPVVAHEIALEDAHVLALNLLRITHEEYGWGPRGAMSWRPYLADTAHFVPYAQRLLAAAFVGELRSSLTIADPSCATSNWADCVRSWGAYCAFGGCAAVIDQDAIELELEWAGVGSSCDDNDSDGYPDLCPPLGAADFNRDGFIDAGDLAYLLGAWGQLNSAADLSGDGVVGAEDLAQFLAAWNP